MCLCIRCILNGYEVCNYVSASPKPSLFPQTQRGSNSDSFRITNFTSYFPQHQAKLHRLQPQIQKVGPKLHKMSQSAVGKRTGSRIKWQVLMSKQCAVTCVPSAQICHGFTKREAIQSYNQQEMIHRILSSVWLAQCLPATNELSGISRGCYLVLMCVERDPGSVENVCVAEKKNLIIH